MSEKSCRTCLYYDFTMGCSAERCNDTFDGWRPKAETVSSVDLVEGIFPKKENITASEVLEREKLIFKQKVPAFSLDKLIDDHWSYVEDLIDYTLGNSQAGASREEYVRAIRFHYKSAFRHGFKHCMEHYGIEEKNDE